MTAEDPHASGSASPPSGLDGLARVWARVKEHKVLQWTLAYLAAALALAHGTELVSQAFEWPHIVPRTVVVLLALGVPIVVTLSWYQGHKGARQVSGPEAAIISLLMVIAAVLLVVFVRPEHPLTQPTPQGERASASGAGEAATTSAPPAALRESPAPAKPRIAILPFENLSPDPANAFFTDGMHEEILTALANSAPGLEVISRTTMMSYKGKPVTVEQVAKDLGVTHVIEGSVRRESNDVRVTLQLIDAKTDEHLWAQNYDRKLVKAMTLQSEVASEVAKQLSVKLAPAAEAARAAAATPTKDPVAYDLYLKARLARENLSGAVPESAWRAVEALLSQAIAHDPGFAEAHIERAGVYWWLYVVNYDTSGKTLELARADLEAARRLAPNSPALFAVEGQLYIADQKFDEALKSFDKAEAAGLTDPDLLIWKASTLPQVGRFEDGLALSARLAALDPGSPYLLSIRAFALAQARRPNDVIATADLVLARAPDNQVAQSGRVNVIFAYTGNRAPLDEYVGRFMAAPPSSAVDPGIAIDGLSNWLRLAGRFQDIRQRIDQAAGESIRPSATLSTAPLGLGRVPLADYRGWADLLLGDKAAAASDGQKVLDFVPRQRATIWSAWFLKRLEADGHLFAGDKAAAAAAARESMRLSLKSAAREHHMLARYFAAWVLTWAGQGDEASALLEDLSTAIPGAPPASIARDPIFTVPLANNARFQALKSKLEAQMAATKLE